MSSACTSPPRHMNVSVPHLSLECESLREAERHKWFLSERAGMDCGNDALSDWVRKHWNGYLRARWLEHLQGVKYWMELNEDDFGLLHERFQDSLYFNDIVRQFLEGGENLTIINWAIEYNLPMAPIEEVLLAININSCRIKCQFQRSRGLAEDC